MESTNKICEICSKPINSNEPKTMLQNCHTDCLLKKLYNKMKNYSYLTYPITWSLIKFDKGLKIKEIIEKTNNSLEQMQKDSIFNKMKNYKSYGQTLFTKIKSEHLDLLPKISLYFDIPKDEAEVYFKNNGIESFKKQIAKSIGDDNFAIIDIGFGSVFAQIVLLEKKYQNKISNFFKKWNPEPLKKIKEKIEQTFFEFEGITVKPKYVKICSSQYTPGEQEKMIKEVLEINKESNSSENTDNDDNYSINKVEQILKTLSKIAQEKEIQVKTLIEFDKGLEIKEVIEKTNNSLEQMQKDSIFEFRIVGLAVVDNMNSTQYVERKSQCPNCESKILIQGTKTRHAANSVANNFITGRDNWYGIGTYFSDQLDYVTYYANETKTFGDIPKIGETFPIAGAEVFYDSTKFKQIYDYSYKCNVWNLPTSADIQEHIDKTIEKDGIHFIEVEGGGTQVITKNREILHRYNDKTEPLPKNIYIGREYVVTDKTQILPLFALTMQRVGYCIIWRDDNFLGGIHKDYLEERKKFVNELSNLNLYIETSTESALKLIWKKKYNKIILITNVGSNLEGKKYIDMARKILGFNVVALFFALSLRHLEWIKDYPNSLFTDTSIFFEKFVMLFNKDEGNEENSLNNLKTEIEEYYDTQLQELIEPVKYPLFEDDNSPNQHYGQLDCSPFEMKI